MQEMLEDPITSSIVGIISLLVGIIGILITVKTMKSAKRIEDDIHNAQVNVLERSRFHKFKEAALKKLQSKRNAAKKEGIVSFSICNDVLTIINDLRGYSKILSKEDICTIEESRKELQEIISILRFNKSINGTVIDFDRIVADIMNILKKGEYEL